MTAPFQVAIPSYCRATTLAAKTLPTLARNQVDPSTITVWVADEAQAVAYRQVLEPGTYGSVRVSAPTLRGSRNAIHREYPEGALLLQVDDDVADLYQSTGRRNTDRQPLPGGVPALVGRLARSLDEVGASLAGIHPVNNPYFHRPGTSVGLRYIVGAFFLMRVERAPWMDVTLEDKEDFERTILHFLARGCVVRAEDVSLVTRYYREPGGMQETRTPQRVHDSAVLLARRYPDLLRLRTSAKGHTEVAFRRLAATPLGAR